jgi:D-beta-D-heptose 7-phosphate kinase/D-beta-D-heptose 1-phosphate adenosyltransferase
MSVPPDRARTIVAGFAAQRILVVGDLMLDRYVYGSVSRISPEAPVPVVEVTRELEAPGGASNVAWNIRAMGARAGLCGLVGPDPAAAALRVLLEGQGVELAPLVVDPDGRTTVKTRVVAERQQVVRVDRECRDIISDAVVERLCRSAAEAVVTATGVIIEDYGKGVVRQAVVDAVLSAAQARGVPVGFDPKENHELRIRGVTIATPNRREAFLAAGMRDTHPDRPPAEDPELLRMAGHLHARWGAELLLVTLGPGGMLLLRKDGPALHVPTRAREVFDVSGAGDTVIGLCVLALAAGANPEEAAHLANGAAGVVVGKLGTAVCTPSELLAVLGD